MESEVQADSNARATSLETTKRPRRARWHNDGTDGTASSLSVLLDWLATEGNYSKWRGGDKQSGETKAVLAAQIAARIHEGGVTHVRKPKDIITKIGQLEQSFRDAVDFLSNTGAGITNEALLQDAIERRCPHYNALKDVFGDRPSVRPLVTSDNALFLSDDDLELRMDGESAEAEDDTALTPDQLSKRQKHNNGKTPRWGSIQSRSPSVSSTLSEWSDLNSALSRSKALEQASQGRMHDEKLELKRMQFQQTTLLEERRVACKEEETRCRVLLLQAQVKKEHLQAQREEMLMKVELATNRKRLRNEP